MEKLRLSSDGYLYTEMIVGLLIMSSMIFVFFPIFDVKMDNFIFKYEIKKVELIIDHMRACAIKNHKSEMVFDKHKIKTICGREKAEDEFSSKLDTNFKNNKVTFNQSANIARAGTITVVNGPHIEKLILHVGYGL